MLNFNANIYNPNFKQQKGLKIFEPEPYSAKQFIIDVKKQEDKRLNGGFFARKMGSPTAYWATLGTLLLGELACFAKIHSVKKNDFPTLELQRKFKNKILFMLNSSLIAGIILGVGIQSWQNRIIDKKSIKPQEFLEKYGNDTSAKLSDKNLRSFVLAAQYNPVSGVIEVNKNYLNDPIGKRLIEKCMKHEIQHARQFEMVAGLDKGLEKLNFATLYPSVQFVKKNPLALAQFKDIIKDVNMDRLGEYDNIKIPISGAEVDLKKYIKAMDILLDNPKAKPQDIPIIIDVAHYKKALAKRGPLSEQEKIKAEEYYQAMLKYPLLIGFNLINPFSGYRSNILEKEARKASKSKTGRIDS